MKKIWLSFLFVITLMIGLCGCTVSKSGENFSEKDQTKGDGELISNDSNLCDQENVIDVVASMDLIMMYDNVEDMSNDAEIIIKGEVIEANSYSSGVGVLTEFQIRVDEAYKNAEVGDIITVVSAGGVLPYSEYQGTGTENIKDFEENIPKEKLSRMKVRVRMGNNDLITVGKKYVIFAKKEQVLDSNSTMTEKYCILNVDQGQFEVQDKNVINKTLKQDYSMDEIRKKIKRR